MSLLLIFVVDIVDDYRYVVIVNYDVVAAGLVSVIRVITAVVLRSLYCYIINIIVHVHVYFKNCIIYFKLIPTTLAVPNGRGPMFFMPQMLNFLFFRSRFIYSIILIEIWSKHAKYDV